MATQAQDEIVADPVGHISISGVHGRGELTERMRHFAPPTGLAQAPAIARDNLAPLLIGAAIGVALFHLLRR